jgi:tetratricopeptide (TPR) repeat protein
LPPAPGLQEPPAPSASVHAAAQRYRAAISLYTQRDYLGAIAELDAAIALDPNLSVAYTARGSARFGLGKLREAAADYKAALDLDPSRAEPIWGLAECQRMLRDPAAPDTYRRYAASLAGDVNEDRRARARRWATELSPPGS